MSKIKKLSHNIFFIALALNFFAHILTMYGISAGFLIEANPIQAFMQSFGWSTSFVILSISWSMIGLFYFKVIPKIYQKIDISKVHVGQFAVAITLFSLLLLDFTNDLLLVNYLNNGSIII